MWEILQKKKFIDRGNSSKRGLERERKRERERGRER